jgi:hypothetical protein
MSTTTSVTFNYTYQFSYANNNVTEINVYDKGKNIYNTNLASQPTDNIKQQLIKTAHDDIQSKLENKIEDENEVAIVILTPMSPDTINPNSNSTSQTNSGSTTTVTNQPSTNTTSKPPFNPKADYTAIASTGITSNIAPTDAASPKYPNATVDDSASANSQQSSYSAYTADPDDVRAAGTVATTNATVSQYQNQSYDPDSPPVVSDNYGTYQQIAIGNSSTLTSKSGYPSTVSAGTKVVDTQLVPLTILQDYGLASYSGPYDKKQIILHWTGGHPNYGSMKNIWANYFGVEYSIGGDGRIFRYRDDQTGCHGSSLGNFNLNCVQIEICGYGHTLDGRNEITRSSFNSSIHYDVATVGKSLGWSNYTTHAGQRFFSEYSNAQMRSLGNLIVNIMYKYRSTLKSIQSSSTFRSRSYWNYTGRCINPFTNGIYCHFHSGEPEIRIDIAPNTKVINLLSKISDVQGAIYAGRLTQNDINIGFASIGI